MVEQLWGGEQQLFALCDHSGSGVLYEGLADSVWHGGAALLHRVAWSLGGRCFAVGAMVHGSIHSTCSRCPSWRQPRGLDCESWSIPWGCGGVQRRG